MEQQRAEVLKTHGFEACKNIFKKIHINFFLQHVCFNFQVLRTLGKGGFSHVFQVKKQEYGVIAAKVMNEDEFDLNEWRTGFQLAQNRNPFILKYHSAQMYGFNAVILMDYANMKV
ncbi:MAG: hypothetical protein EZS28_050131 [Streblomastix strix]|uniref:Protein kinase domain-containing protein n=1 Tax=Streblomastix strix TaxID=222440 RepID=A0A5J4T8Q8_9EUKA|nr:MAG: hypothetical protein EZS28_050131 [Streblomastix strix]